MEQQDFRRAVIVSTDLEGLSGMLRTDEASALATHGRYADLLKSTAQSGNGKMIRTVGASNILEFRTPQEAVAFAIRLQNDASGLSGEQDPLSLGIRIGIHEGEVRSFQGDVIGDGITVADGLRAYCAPGRICISGAVHERVGSRIELGMKHLGTKRIEGAPSDIDVWEMDLAGDEPERETPREAPRGRSAYDAFPKESAREDSKASGSRSRRSRDEDENEYPVDLDELKDLVLGSIKSAGRKFDIETLRRRLPRGPEVDRMLNRLADRGFISRSSRYEDGGGDRDDYTDDWSRREWRNEWRDSMHELKHEWKRHARAIRHGRYTASADPVEEYRMLVAEQAEKGRSGFFAHLVSYVSVNGFLLFLNIVTGGGHPWFFYPAGGWGIGLATNFYAMKRKNEEARTLAAFPELSVQETGLLQKFFGARAGFSGHFVSNLAVALFLFGINLITSSNYPWFLYPAAGMGLGVAIHWSTYVTRTRGIVRKLREMGSATADYLAKKKFRHGSLKPVEVKEGERLRNPENQSLYQESLRVRNSILEQLKRFGKNDSPLGADAEKTLDAYVEQIRALGQKDDELEALIGGMPMTELERDLARLRQRVETTQAEYLRKEYEKSIDEIERQKKSYNDLKDQKEVLHLRFRSAVNNLKQMQIDLARMQGLSDTTENSTIMMIKDRTRELSEYLDDFREGYDELER